MRSLDTRRYKQQFVQPLFYADDMRARIANLGPRPGRKEPATALSAAQRSLPACVRA